MAAELVTEVVTGTSTPSSTLTAGRARQVGGRAGHHVLGWAVAELGAGCSVWSRSCSPTSPTRPSWSAGQAGGVAADAVLVDQVAGQAAGGIPGEVGEAEHGVGWPGIGAGGMTG